MADSDKGTDNTALAQKIRSLLKKKEENKKELEKIEDILKKEDEEVKAEVEKTVRELREEEEKRFEESQKTRKQEQPPLEQTVFEEAPQNVQSTSSQFGYSTIDSNKLQGGNLNVYDLATREVYDKVKDIVNTPAEFRTNEERNFLKGLGGEIDRMKREDMYFSEKDSNDYVIRTQKLITGFYK